MKYLFLIVFFFSGVEAVNAQVYKWVDESGRTHYSDTPQALGMDPEQQGVVANKSNADTKYTVSYPKTTVTFHARELLSKKKFNALNQYLAGLEKRADENVVDERDLHTAFNVFRVNDKSYEAVFNQWVKATPENYFPYLARARYYYGLGWMVRGHSWASETKKEKMQAMADYFNKAMTDINTVFKMNDQSLVAYITVINIANTFGKEEQVAAVTKKALEIQPASYEVRSAYLNSIIPRWGGSYKKMAMFIEYSLRYVDENPKLRCLAGKIHEDKASMSRIQSAPHAAEKEYTQALSFGECHSALNARGQIRYILKQYKEAQEDFNRAIELYPESADYYYWRAKNDLKLENNDMALSDVQYAEKLNPYHQKAHKLHEWLLVNEGYGLRQTSRTLSEIDKYNAALRINPKHSGTLLMRAQAYIAEGKNNQALQDLNQAIQLDPYNIDYYVLVDFVLAKSSSWAKIIPYWNHYIKLNPSSGRAYRERSGTYYRMGNMTAAKRDIKKSAELGDPGGKDIYKRLLGGK